MIDTHVHLYDPTRPQGIPWPNKEQPASIYRRFLPGDYAKIAEPYGVVGAIETECSPWIEDNYWVMEVSKNEPIMVGEVGDLLLGHPDYAEQLERLHRNPLYVGIRVSNLWGRNVEELLKKPQVWTDIKALAGASLAMDFGGGPREVRQLLQITDKVPNLRIVINHLPGARIPDDPSERAAWQKQTQELAKRPHIYVKFSEIYHRVDPKVAGWTRAGCSQGSRLLQAAPGRNLRDLRARPADVRQRLDQQRADEHLRPAGGPGLRVFLAQGPRGHGKSVLEELAVGLSLEEAPDEPAQPGLNRDTQQQKHKGANAMLKQLAGAVILAALWTSPVMAQALSAPPKLFDATCEACHGEGGAGGDRAPSLVNNPFLRTQTEAQIRELISNGTPGGMPAFKLPDGDLRSLAQWVHSLNVSAFDTKPVGNVAAGEALFFSNGGCAGCHMVQGRGKANGPDLSSIGRRSIVRELELVLDNPTSQMGIHTTASCPRWAFCPDDSWRVVNVTMRDGKTLRGFARGRAETRRKELQTLDGATAVPDRQAVCPDRSGEKFHNAALQGQRHGTPRPGRLSRQPGRRG